LLHMVVMNFGIGIVNMGFLFLNIKVIDATYNGTAAKTKMQNVNPPKPCKCA